MCSATRSLFWAQPCDTRTQLTEKQVFVVQPLHRAASQVMQPQLDARLSATCIQKSATTADSAAFNKLEAWSVWPHKKGKGEVALARRKAWMLMLNGSKNRRLATLLCLIRRRGMAQQTFDRACFMGVSVCWNASGFRPDSKAHSGSTCGSLVLINTSLPTCWHDLCNYSQLSFFGFFFRAATVHEEGFWGKSIPVWSTLGKH